MDVALSSTTVPHTGASGRETLGGGGFPRFGHDNNLWFTEFGSARLARFNPTTPGAVTTFNIAGSAPSGIAAGSDNNLWLVDCTGNRIIQSSTTGTTTQFTIPTPNAVNARNIWFTEWSGNKVGRITPAGTITEFVVPTAASAPNGIVVGPDGNLWFAETDAGKIASITP